MILTKQKKEIDIVDFSGKNWKYKITYSDRNTIPDIDVTSDEEIKHPETISKYYSLNDYSVDAFLNNRIYLAQPNQMNDLFEPNHKSFGYENVTMNNPNFNQVVANTLFQDYMSRFGILCTTPNQEDDLMWAHYTQNSGFLIEFDYSQFPQNFKGPFPINYYKKEKRIDINEYDWNLAYYVECLTKNIGWKYENEYRFLFHPKEKDELFKVHGIWGVEQSSGFNQVERSVEYPTSAIKKMILGIRILEGADKKEGNHNSTKIRFKDYRKVVFFNKLCDSNFPIECICQNQGIYKLQTLRLEIKRIDEGYFDIKIVS